MFREELKKKLDMAAEALPFTLTMLSRTRLVVSGAKGVLLSSEQSIKLKLPRGSVSVEGESLAITEIGGGDVFIRGSIKEVRFDD